ncbi:hypothetical protein LGK95_12270 [Clostridium algoriphilum]|uniref:hypothetical protein n=1 Tax=Clostridium algoriphilum TaxID=198347 RepID=UPI001CF215D6|nr:hypothetical protein [Clostridium algoriphilum]MCB2294291.1 hypothetical protein [Clostridium algoriphilum]
MEESDTKNLVELMKYKDLIDTVIEGFNYVNSKLKVGEFNKSIEIFAEMITGINAVVSGLGNKMNANSQGMKEHKDKINEYLELLVSAYEQRDTNKIMFVIDTMVIPCMKEIQNYCY